MKLLLSLVIGLVMSSQALAGDKCVDGMIGKLNSTENAMVKGLSDADACKASLDAGSGNKALADKCSPDSWNKITAYSKKHKLANVAGDACSQFCDNDGGGDQLMACMDLITSQDNAVKTGFDGFRTLINSKLGSNLFKASFHLNSDGSSPALHSPDTEISM